MAGRYNSNIPQYSKLIKFAIQLHLCAHNNNNYYYYNYTHNIILYSYDYVSIISIISAFIYVHSQNSVRHNLSLNPAFRKVQHSMRWQGKKGFYWEVTPERRSSVEREVERYLWQEGKITEMGVANGSKSCHCMTITLWCAQHLFYTVYNTCSCYDEVR